MSIAAWIKRGSLDKAAANEPFALIFGYGVAGYNVGLSEDGRLFLGKVGQNAVFSGCRIKDQDFHHMLITKDGNKIIFYLDGTAVPAVNYSAIFEFNTNVAVGALPDSFGAGLIGTVDELMVFNRALTAEEAKTVYELKK